MTRHSSLIRRAVPAASALAAAAAALALAGPAGAATQAGVTFDTPGEHALTLPGYVSSVTITAVGAAGGSNSAAAGGSGARATGTVDVSPGQTLYAVVGGAGGNGVSGNRSGGFNGG